jgi:SAM-dependent methyltransferase
MVMLDTRKDNWAAGELYEPYVGRWSRLVARDFLRWLELPAQLDWLDVGCGTGALTQTVLQQAQPRSATGIDPSAGFIGYAKTQINDPGVTFEVADAQSLPVQSARFDVAVSGLVLNFVPKPLLAVKEMARAVRPQGVVAAYVWDYAGKMELMRYFWDAAVAVDPDAVKVAEAIRFPICQPPALVALFNEAGLRDVQTHTIDIPTTFRDFDDYWKPFLGGQGPAPAYVMSLTEERRGVLRDRIRAMLPIASDGSIPLIARAWAVRGRAGQ